MSVRFNPSMGMFTDINSIDQDGKPVDAVVETPAPKTEADAVEAAAAAAAAAIAAAAAAAVDAPAG